MKTDGREQNTKGAASGAVVPMTEEERERNWAGKLKQDFTGGQHGRAVYNPESLVEQALMED